MNVDPCAHPGSLWWSPTIRIHQPLVVADQALDNAILREAAQGNL